MKTSPTADLAALTDVSLIDSFMALAPATLSPRELPWPGRVLAVDTNYLASTACHLAVRPDVVSQLQQEVAGDRAQVFSRPRSWSSLATPHAVLRGAMISLLRQHDAFIESSYGWVLGRAAL